MPELMHVNARNGSERQVFAAQDIKRETTMLVPRGSNWKIGMVAGLLGGLAEVLWMVLFQGISGADAAAVARGVAGSFDTSLGASSLAVPLGIATHMGLAMLLGVAIAVTVRPFLLRLGKPSLEPVCVLAILVAVWATNVFVVLPLINPEFVVLLPYEASLVSKVLFGAAAASVFWLSAASQRQSDHRSRSGGGTSCLVPARTSGNDRNIDHA